MPSGPRVPEPALTDDITAAELDTEVRRDLRGLQRDTADSVARHLVAAGRLVDEDPQRALAHARYARNRASRIAMVREAAGIAAYHAGEWAEALGELRAARRMGGGPGHLAVMADIERALGRPERALELSRGPEVRELDQAEGIELAIVAAGARRDLGELDAAVVSLQIGELDPARRDPWSARLFYAYADNLLAAGRESDALKWFVHAADVDDDGETDSARRIAELTGEPLPDEDDDFEFGLEDERAAPSHAGDALPSESLPSDAGDPDVSSGPAGDEPAVGATDAAQPGPADTASDDVVAAGADGDEPAADDADAAKSESVGCAADDAVAAGTEGDESAVAGAAGAQPGPVDTAADDAAGAAADETAEPFTAPDRDDASEPGQPGTSG